MHQPWSCVKAFNNKVEVWFNVKLGISTTMKQIDTQKFTMKNTRL